MKKIMSMVLISVIICGVASSAYAGTPVGKLGRGVMNVTTAVLELPKSWAETNQASGIAAGATQGTFDGIARVLLKGLVGVYEVATFPIGVPDNYEPILRMRRQVLCRGM